MTYTAEQVFGQALISHATIDGEDGPAPEKGPYIRLISAKGATMTPLTIVGPDPAKSVFHVHVTDGSGAAIDHKRLVRR